MRARPPAVRTVRHRPARRMRPAASGRGGQLRRVHVGRGKQRHEERQQQRGEVGVRHQPAVGADARYAAAAHDGALATARSGEAARPDPSTAGIAGDQAAHRLRQQARMHPAAQAHHGFEDQFAAASGGQRALAQAPGQWQQQQVREPEPVDGGDERHRHAAAERARRAEALHHVHEAEHGAEDAEGGRIAGGRLEDAGRLVVDRLAGAHLGGQQVAQQRRLDAVHRERQAVAQEVVLDADRARSRARGRRCGAPAPTSRPAPTRASRGRRRAPRTSGPPRGPRPAPRRAHS